MPIEVKELVVKATVVENNARQKTEQGLSRADVERMKQEIVQTCLDLLKQELTKQKER